MDSVPIPPTVVICSITQAFGSFQSSSSCNAVDRATSHTHRRDGQNLTFGLFKIISLVHASGVEKNINCNSLIDKLIVFIFNGQIHLSDWSDWVSYK